MATRYLQFFNAATDVWKHTLDVTQDSLKETGEDTNGMNVLDLASGPGEPGVTIAKNYSDSKVTITDGAEAMLNLADDRIADANLKGRVRTQQMELHDFTPVKGLQFDLATAQFALMFTPDFGACLNEITSVLRPNGVMVGTVWEQFDVLVLLRQTMMEVLGKDPPPPPINPLSLKDIDYVDPELEKAGFRPLSRHNETERCDFNIGDVTKSDEPYMACLIPVTPALQAMKDEGKHDDPMGAALHALKNAAESNGHIRDGHFHVEGTYRYFAVQHSQ